MSATITDKFNKAADGNGSYPTLATVSATRSASEATLTCQDLTGWATDTPVHFSTYQLNSSGVVDTTTQTDWKGIVSGNTITNLTRIAGAADTGNAIGDIVELNPTIGWLDDLVTGLLATHKQDGSLKDNIVKSNNIDWATIRDIDVSSYFNISVSSIARAKITVFGKIGLVNLGFNPTSNITTSKLLELPESLDIKPLYTTELCFTIGDGDSRRALVERSSGHTYISTSAHTSSANKFCRIFGMFFLQ